MKTLLLSLLLILSAMLLIGFKCDAQSRDSDRDWIDSLAVKYRNDFIESAISLDQVAVDRLSEGVNILILNSQIRNRRYSRATNDELIKAILHYGDERRAQELRKRDYEIEMLSARTNFER